MKRITILLFVLIFISKSLIAQAVPIDSTTNLYYLCKIWGYLKYFHTEVAKVTINWDNVLLRNINAVKTANTGSELTNSLLNVINAAGTMRSSSVFLPNVPAELKYNLSLDWIESNYLPAEVKAKLTEVKTLFRPQSNYYVSSTSVGNPDLKNDNSFFTDSFSNSESIRMLALFRYWNIINYFFPYKNIMDKNWDDVLKEFIPKVIVSSDDYSYNYTMMELFTRINDSHASSSSSVISSLKGSYYLPLKLKYIDGKTIIDKVSSITSDCRQGDIIKSINGKDVNIIRDSLKKYTQGSNEITIQRNISAWLLRQRKNDVPVRFELENESGLRSVNLNTYDATTYYQLFQNNDPVWKIINRGDKSYGYIDMGRLTTDMIPVMFNDLWKCCALIFDIRSYPQGTMWYMINYLFRSQIIGAHFTLPSSTYPGTLTWTTTNYVGTGDFSKNYENPIYILLNENTLSQAEFTVMHLEKHPKAVKIGSQTAGADGNVSLVYLPYGVATYFTGMGVFYPDKRPTQRIGIVPDIEVKPTIQGIRAGRDEVLEAAFNHYTTTAVETENELPKQYSLTQNYPNPFNPTTTIKYSIVETLNATLLQRVILKVYDLLGREVSTLVDEIKPPGNYSVPFSAGNLPSGAYFYRLQTGDYSETKKLLLLK